MTDRITMYAQPRDGDLKWWDHEGTWFLCVWVDALGEWCIVWSERSEQGLV